MKAKYLVGAAMWAMVPVTILAVLSISMPFWHMAAGIAVCVGIVLWISIADILIDGRG